MIDLRKLAAQEAVQHIKNETVVGFGAGTAIAYAIGFLAERIKNENLKVQVVTSAAATRQVCEKHGILLGTSSAYKHIDLYFDGCDQFDYELNALKSGAGIHTLEKICASLADEFIIIADESKRTPAFSTKFPVVIDVLPTALLLVLSKLKEIVPTAKPEIRKDHHQENILTENGNVLIDIWFDIFPELALLHQQLKAITGVVETSLFIGLAHKAIAASDDGVRTYVR